MACHCLGRFRGILHLVDLYELPSSSVSPLFHYAFTYDDIPTARWYSNVFKFTLCVMAVDFLLNMIWFPIGVSRTYGFRSAHEAFLTTCRPVVLLRGSLLMKPLI